MIRKHLARKAAYKQTRIWNRTFGEKVGMYPKFFPGNTERYKRAGVFMNALVNQMKMYNLSKTPVHRGISGNQMNTILKNRSINRNTFTSFSFDPTVAHKFANSFANDPKNRGIVLTLQNKKVPGIMYNGRTFISQFPGEREILLPPGKLTLGTQIIPGVFKVSFTQKNVNFNALERNANKKYTYTNTKKNSENNSNWKLARNASRILSRSEMKKKLKNDIEKVQNMEVQLIIGNAPYKKLNTLAQMKRRLQNSYNRL